MVRISKEKHVSAESEKGGERSAEAKRYERFRQVRGVARIFQRGVTQCQNEGTRQISMSFLPSVVGCLLKTWLTKGGHGHPRTPPGCAPASP